MNIPIPQQTARVFESAPRNLSKHPGLLLDKFVDSFRPEAVNKWQEGVQKPTIELAIKQTIDEKFWATVSARHDAMTASATRFDARTTGPLTMHLSRAGALENAGLCLHPIYGFAYLPGTGLKGLARAYAETIAKPAGEASLADILTVFGKSPTRTDKSENAGSIIFFDAWPTAVPKLEIDIVNNHHSDYYTNKEGRNPPPGDWEAPVPVYFIAVAKNTTFRFAIRKRRDDVPDRLLDLARQWLIGGLTHLGAGAKTNAGYGSFVEVISGPDKPKPLLPENAPRATFNCTLELVTPAFLAGAKQDASDCDLRPATLRGQLRWWWRTLHAGYLPVEQLRTLEAAIWGDTNRGGAVRVDLMTTRRTKTAAIRTKRGGSPADPLKYISYGMDDDPVRPSRFYLEPGATWQLRLTAKPTQFIDPTLRHAQPVPTSQNDVMAQATAALSLLCTYGGVGAKARKGFGSLKIVHRQDAAIPDSPQRAIKIAQGLRIMLGLSLRLLPDSEQPYPSLDDRNAAGLDNLELPPGRDVWDVLRHIGRNLKEYVTSLPKGSTRGALGVPRKNGEVPGIARHPSPYHIHLRCDGGRYYANVLRFTAHRLPDTRTSRKVLDGFLDKLDRIDERN